MSEKEEDDERHCDYVIHDFKKPMALRWYLFINRLPAADKGLCFQNGVKDPVLYAKYKGEWVRVVMASRFGDVGITDALDAEYGYDKRVAVDDLEAFTDKRPLRASRS
jgi:hypothetical protein